MLVSSFLSILATLYVLKIERSLAAEARTGRIG